MWVVYANPLDFPDKIVVRHWVASAQGEQAREPHVCDTIEQAREIVQQIAPGSVRLPRSLDDDQSIVEVWL
jgi:hypothetical protein